VTGLLWTAIIAGFLMWNISNEKAQTLELAKTQTEAFYKEFVMARLWISFHGGVYVPITEETQPNPYLDDPFRDIETTGGMKLTKVNPAFMTRQIAKLAKKKGLVRVHLAALEPSRPENEPDPWEKESLIALKKGEKDQFAITGTTDDIMKYRYMAPLILESACMKCHEQSNDKVGDLKGGISVTIPAEPYILAQNKHIMQFAITYFIIWLLGFLGLWTGFYALCKNERERETLILQLQKSLIDVKKLGGLLPICSSCKKIRNDEGYWEQVEKYIKERSEADFSHGICPQCAKELYPKIYDKLSKQDSNIAAQLRKQDKPNKQD
jgi:hypothetical protein